MGNLGSCMTSNVDSGQQKVQERILQILEKCGDMVEQQMENSSRVPLPDLEVYSELTDPHDMVHSVECLSHMLYERLLQEKKDNEEIARQIQQRQAEQKFTSQLREMVYRMDTPEETTGTTNNDEEK